MPGIDHSGLARAVAIRSRFAEALARAKRAVAAEEKDDHAEAKRLWCIEMGDAFPCEEVLGADLRTAGCASVGTGDPLEIPRVPRDL